MPTASEPLLMRAVPLAGTQWADAPFIRLLPDGASPLVWSGSRRRMAGWGRAAEWKGSGADAIRDAGAWWDSLRASARLLPDPAGAHEGPPALPIAFGSFGFSARTESALIVPEILLIETPRGRWALSSSRSSSPADPLEVLASLPPADLRRPEGVRTDAGRMTQGEWSASVQALAARLRAGDASKAVMTRDMLVRADSPIDPRHLVERLDALYPQTWRFAVDSLIGATPEMLASAQGGLLHSRVLAGTSPAGRGSGLLESEKNLREHALAVESVAEALRPIVEELHVPKAPFVLELPNVDHLATDVDARLGGASLLGAVAALHPTAAVCGTPRDRALALLEEHERTERGRYSGPVGWIDGAGDGEFCIALRCGALEEGGRALRIFAGGGIMPDSDPAEELAETRRKMTPLLDALGVSARA